VIAESGPTEVEEQRAAAVAEVESSPGSENGSLTRLGCTSQVMGATSRSATL
jgi:hypothetical protein